MALGALSYAMPAPASPGEIIAQFKLDNIVGPPCSVALTPQDAITFPRARAMSTLPAGRGSLPALLFTAALLLAIPANFILLMTGGQHYVPRTLAFNLGELVLLLAVGALVLEKPARLYFYPPGDYVFALYVLWSSLVVAYHLLFGPTVVDELGRSAANYNRAVLTLQVFWYLVGRLAMQRAALSGRSVGVIYLVLLLVVLGSSSLEQLGIDFEEVAGEEGLNYLAFADPFAIWALLLVGRAAGRSWRSTLVWVSAMAALFLIGSRGTLYAFICAGIVYGMVIAPRVWLTIIAAAAVSAVTIVGSVVDDVDDLGRMFAIVRITQDPSFIERVEEREVGFERIAQHPLEGDYAGVVQDFGNLGAYIHDVTSYWQQFGLGPFVLVVAMLLVLGGVAFAQAAKRIRAPPGGADYLDTFLVLYYPFVVVQMAAARSYDWPFCWLVIGLAAARLNARTKHRLAMRRPADGHAAV